MTRLRVVCFIGVPRTGSTRVISLLNAFDGLMAKGEIFHPAAVHSLEDECQALGQLVGVDTHDVRDKTLVERVRARPDDVIDWLLDRSNGRTLVFKLFADHLDIPHLNQLFSRRDIGFVVVRRRPIDCYISELKARKTGKWKLADSTGVRVLGDVRQFIGQCNSQLEWYRFCRTLAAENARPTADLSYERQIAQRDAFALPALEAMLRSMRVDPGFADLKRIFPLVRQDRSQSYEAKMINWPQFERELRTVPNHQAAFVE